MFGLSVATATPFTRQGEIELETFRQHVTRLMETDVSSITFFGTTGEGPSISLDEKLKVLYYLCPKYLNPSDAIVSIICTNTADAKKEIANYNQLGINRFLIAPPYFFGNPCGLGLREWFSEIFSAQVQTNNQFILYNIPQMTGVEIENELISELREKFGNRIVCGIKDSSGDMKMAKRYLKNKGFVVAIGDERLIADTVALGASGSICGLSNVFPQKILQMIKSHGKDSQIDSLIVEILKFPVTPGVKAILALSTQNNIWLNVRPPLAEASKAQITCLEKIIKAYV